jgi:phage terminase small subunit
MANDISPLKNLNERQAAFVKEYIVCGDPHRAALAAGYAEGTARVAGTQILEMPNIALAIARAARLRLARGVPLAIETIEWLISNSPSHKVRLDAATRLLDRAGVVPPKPHDERGGDVPLHEMSLEDLQKKVDGFMEVIENDRARRAKDVTTPDDLVEDLAG